MIMTFVASLSTATWLGDGHIWYKSSVMSGLFI